MNLEELGWDSRWAEVFKPFLSKGWIQGRIVREEKALYGVNAGSGELRGRISGTFRKGTKSPSDFPKVGDWVAVAVRPAENSATIHAVLPRKNFISRKEPWVQTQEQTLAVNLDTLFLVMALDQDFNIRRFERYLSMAFDGGVEPYLVLNKSDLCPNVEDLLAQVARAAPGVPLCVASVVDGTGLEGIKERLGAGKTVAFVGSTGVGKSSLINRLLGTDLLGVGDLREDGSGGHTTTRRELVHLPGGGWMMDTPGLRELQLWGDEAGIEKLFAEMTALSEKCRFSNCLHESEPDCAVRLSLDKGELDQGRYLSYLKLAKESRKLETKKVERQRRKARTQGRPRQSDPREEGANAWLPREDE